MTSFYPAVNGRATSQLGQTRLLFQIHHDELAIQDLQTQLSTGRRLSIPSQDPAAAIRGLAAQRQLEYKSQVDENLQSANTILAATESTLSQSQSILNEIRGIAVQANGTTFSPEEQEAFAVQIDAAIAKLTELGNAKFRDQYIFGGSAVLSTPLEAVGDSVRFSGNTEELRTISDYASTISANVTANDAFGVRASKVISSIDLDPSIAADTPLSLLNRGDGIRGGAISFRDGVNLVQVDLASVHNLSDIIEKVNAVSLGTRALQATLTTSGLSIAYQDGGSGLLRVEEVGSGTTAADLGINNSASSGLSPVFGSDLNPVLTKQTRLSQLFAGTGITIGDTFQIKQGTKTFSVSTNGLSTLEDLINRIHRSGVQAKASLDPTGRFLQIQSTESGTALSIGENNAQLASKLGLRTMDLNTPLSELNFGQGVFANDLADDLVLVRSNGTEMRVNLDGAQNIQDVLNRVNNHVDNFTPALRITASLSAVGNGIVLSAPTGTVPIQVRNEGGSQAAWGLGLVPTTASSSTGTADGGLSVIRGSDVGGVEVEGVFTSLIRLRQAVEQGKSEDLVRITQALDADIQRLSLSRSIVGARQQSIDRIKDLSAEQQLQLKGIESEELDADLASVISELSARQAALQASLQLMGQASRLSLFDYI